jgi:HD superfamily phosphohydrolase YqeK
MGKLKEKLLNNLSEQEMEDMFGISAFEYVELMSKYKDDENYVPTAEEVEDIEKMVEDYYASKEFRDYVEELDIDEINDSLQVKFTEDEVIEAIRSLKNEEWFINGIRRELNRIWNRKNGYL